MASRTVSAKDPTCSSDDTCSIWCRMEMQLSETASCVGACLTERPARARRMNLSDGFVTNSFHCWSSDLTSTDGRMVGALLCKKMCTYW